MHPLNCAFSQGEDPASPPVRDNPYCPWFLNALFEAELEQKDARCTNTKVKCVCHRFLRSQSYRAVALALGIRGHNHQITWAPPVKAFIRGAYPVGDGVPAGTDVPAMEPDEIRAWETEPNPTEEQVEEWVSVLRRVCPATAD
jgi:hypothetical protein